MLDPVFDQIMSNSATKIIIDHHLQANLASALEIIDITSSSCAEFIWELINSIDPHFVNHDIANYCLV